MKVLVACEFSGIVRDAFIARGHDAMSCDLLPTERPGPHYQGDVRNILNDGWDLMIVHPPCTFLALSGVRWLVGESEKELTRWYNMVDACIFFNLLLDAKIPKVCIENPIQHGYARRYIRKYDQIIQPWQFGEEIQKSTCLWLKGLSKLRTTKIVGKGKIYAAPRRNGHGGEFTMRAKKSYTPCHFVGPVKDRWKIRSRFFPGIAAAMAAQWGGKCQ